MNKFKVTITPKISNSEYGEPFDVTDDFETDFVKKGGLSRIRRRMESNDFDFGKSSFDHITLNLFNDDGRFNDSFEPGSLFPVGRDNAKVDIYYLSEDSNYKVVFSGLIYDEATRLEFGDFSYVKFKILSPDAILKKEKLPGGTISNGQFISQALHQVLSLPVITNVAQYNPSELELSVDSVIDKADALAGKSIDKVIADLMLASNSIFLIKSDGSLIVKPRDYHTKNIFRFYGGFDLYDRSNIIKIEGFNNGRHRSFNSISVNEFTSEDSSYVEEYGFKSKTIELDFITSEETSTRIANNILKTVKVPKREFTISVPAKDVLDLDFLDLVSVNYSKTPSTRTKIPRYNISNYGEAQYPKSRGAIEIRESEAYRVVGIEFNIKDDIAKISLKQRGITVADGVFSTFISVYGQAIYGISDYEDDSNWVNPSEVSIYDAAKYGVTKYGSE